MHNKVEPLESKNNQMKERVDVSFKLLLLKLINAIEKQALVDDFNRCLLVVLTNHTDNQPASKHLTNILLD